ncbi:hypothetical protein HII36_29160 [Nonomuraea sp. NN258]|nr:hypothetical protein [Nonomuraea antri]
MALPGGLGTAYEDPADAVRLAYLRAGQNRAYARDPRTGAFADIGPHTVVAEPSPDGRWLAWFNTLYAASSDHLALSFHDRLTGERFSVPVLRPPYQSLTPAWSRDGTKVLLSAQRYERFGDKDVPVTVGYVIVDVAARTARFVATGDALEVRQAARAAAGKLDPSRYYSEYRWAPDGRTVAARFLTAEWGHGVRFRDAESGRVTRMMHWVGQAQGLTDWFSPSGRRFVTSGCAAYLAACVWRTSDGSREATVRVPTGATTLGWYDDRHLIHLVPDGESRRRVVVVDLSGKRVRTLAELRVPDEAVVDLRYGPG